MDEDNSDASSDILETENAGEPSDVQGLIDSSPSNKVAPEWSVAEERKLVWKFDLFILPLLTLCFFCMQMDRGNIGNAVVNGLLEDINISQDQYNIGQQLLYIGIVVLEIPSNLILYRIGPRWWLGGQIVAWGLVHIFQSFIKNVAGFYTTRLLLGLCEAGFIPAGLYCLSLWYKRAETSTRFTIFYFGNLVSQGATSLLAYGIFHLDGQLLSGWQWMFILEGIFTVCMGLALMLFLPKDPTDPVPLSGLNYFTPQEREIMRKRIILEDPSKLKTTESVSWRQFLAALGTLRIYPHMLISMCGIAPVVTWIQYAPSLVADLGYDRLKSNALVSIGGWLQIPVSLMLAIFADKFQRRGLALLAGVFLVWVSVIGDLVVRTSDSTTKRFVMLTITLAFSSTWQPLNGSWLSLNAVSPAERSVTLAMFVMSTNIGGIIGSQLFQKSDRPVYTRGWFAIFALETVSLAAIVFANMLYRVYNWRRRKQTSSKLEIVEGLRVLFWL